jgi:hypothetical protein
MKNKISISLQVKEWIAVVAILALSLKDDIRKKIEKQLFEQHDDE